MADTDDKVEQVEQTIEELEARIEELESKIQELESMVGGHDDRIEDLDTTMGEQNETIDDLGSRVDELESVSDDSAVAKEEFLLTYNHIEAEGASKHQTAFKFKSWDAIREILLILKSSNIIDQDSIKLYLSSFTGRMGTLTELPQ